MYYENYYGMTVYEMLKKAKDTFGDKILFSYMKKEQIQNVSYQEFWKDVGTVAGHLEALRLKGKYVVLEGKSDYEIVTALYAVISVGAVAAILNLDLPEEEVFDALERIQPAMIISSEDNSDIAEEYAKKYHIYSMLANGSEHKESIRSWIKKEGVLYEPDGEQKPEDPALVLMTSGSTSKSKLVLLPHYTFLPTKEFCTERNILVFPLYHVAGIMELTNSVLHGLTLCLSNMREGIRDLEWFCPTELMAVPAFIFLMVKRNRKNLLDLSHYQRITSGGAPQNLEVTEYLNSLGIFSSSAYGTTETSGQVACSTLSAYRFGSVGKPGSWNEVKISENGEILVKGKMVMLEYLGNPKETEEALEDGWYHTGDVGHIDEDGFLYVTGRIKNVIVLSNGENVSPEAIEAQLYHCTDIEEAVVGSQGDTIVAQVYCGELSDEKIRKNVETYIAKYNRTVPSYRCIRKIVFREEAFAKTSSGKIKR